MTTTAKDARSLLAVRLGDGQHLVPDDARPQGACAIIAAALTRLTDMRRERARVLHHRSAPVKACSRPLKTEEP
jgi:hypothetical protein